MKNNITRATVLLLLFLLMTSASAWSQSVNCLPSDIGKVLGMDGKVYATVSAAGGMSSVSGMIAYVNTSTHEGIAIGPADLYYNSNEGSGQSSVTTAISACSNYTRTRPSAATTGWRLPSQADFNNMIGSSGCLSADNLRNMKGRQSSSCGVWGMIADGSYWSSTETPSGQGIYYNLWKNDCNSIAYGAKLYIPQGHEDYAIAFSEKSGEMPVNFEASEDGTYTITVSPEGVAMNYLHLIDNLTGANVDLMAQPSYTFEARISDYASRFKLVFSARKNIEEIGDNEPFAFIHDGEIIFESDGIVQVIDMMGRIIVQREAGVNTVFTNTMAPGVYVLQLVNDEKVKTQKIVVK